MLVSPGGRALIESFEGCRLEAYRDITGVLTIGYGHTAGVEAGQTITQEEADKLLATDLANVYGAGVDHALENVPTSQAQFDAMVSLAYNIGVGAFTNSSVCRLHRAGATKDAAKAFLLYNKAGGRVIAALARRRVEESRLYLSSDNAVVPEVIAPSDRIKAIQIILGVSPDADFGPNSRAKFTEILSLCGQAGVN